MQLTKWQRLALTNARRVHDTGSLSFAAFLGPRIKRFVTVSLFFGLIVVIAWPYSGLLPLCCFYLGVLFGSLLADVKDWRAFLRMRPVNEFVIDWDRVDQLLGASADSVNTRPG